MTDYAVPDGDVVDPDDPATFVPCVADARGVTPVAAAYLMIPASPTGPSFQVISSIDLATRQRLDTASVMGRADVTDMSDDASSWPPPPTSPQPRPSSPLIRDTGGRGVAQKSDLVRIELADGAVTVAATASIPGIPLNQFALDHFDGHLRVAVTMDGTIASGGWARYPTLFILDDALNVVASLPKLVSTSRANRCASRARAPTWSATARSTRSSRWTSAPRPNRG
nr:beta-propeller domain-containing protein [Tessaracoccus antarcticus]